jgi:4-amino-4-deoxy-L-arabinose transferase-like glycosyltransferase
MPYENDPLYRLRHALTGLALALALSVPVAALLGRWIGDAVAGTYGARVAVYGLLLLHVVVGAVVLFTRVARHETRPVSVQRVLLWVLSLWLWPALFARSRGPRSDAPPE